MSKSSLASYLDFLASAGRSSSYVNKQRRVIGNLIATGNPAKALEALSTRATQATVNDALNRLKCYGKWLGEDNPYCDLRPPHASRVRRSRAVFTRKEVVKLLACREVPPVRRTLWRVLATTGLRPIEASRLLPAHILRDGGRWVMQLPANCQKARRSDPIELDEKTAKLIKKHSPLVQGASDKLYRKLRVDLASAGIPLLQGGVARTPYDFRRFFVTELIRSGVDAETVRQLARHRDIETTLRHYTKFTEGEVGATRCRIFANI